MLIARAREDGGFTLPVVLLMVLAAFAVASAAVLASFSAQSGTIQDYQSKDAFATAEAGAHEAMLRYNATTVSGDSWGQCLTGRGGPGARLSRRSCRMARPTSTGLAFLSRFQGHRSRLTRRRSSRREARTASRAEST